MHCKNKVRGSYLPPHIRFHDSLSPTCTVLHVLIHNDSLDTLLYVRFVIQNLEFHEWKLGDRGWALS